MKKIILPLIIAVLCVLSSGCVTEKRTVLKNPPPPPPAPTEFITPAPNSRAIWVPGRWVWKGGRRGYVWVPGHWVKK